ncbi:glycine receptor subunit alpha-3 [Aplysia californica]|uniref:Glycine receptor subunit alpha-3 n=1 Tax=Aplysia californica TaxID=6500 RepID=A0ABM1A2D3_APLCA|nr:glycine receptor subunit alpha-3 [Aplysia californica]
MHSFLGLLALFAVWAFVESVPNNSSAAARVLSSILSSNDYDPKIPPYYNEEYPAEVTVQLKVLSIDNVDEASMDYSLTVFLRQIWTDPRLRFAHGPHDNDSTVSPHDELIRHSLDRLELDSRVTDQVWHPDTFFANERKADVHDVTVPNKLLHIFSNGTVFYSMRISMTLTCHMNLEKYPFDRQKCPLVIASYGYTSHTVSYVWMQPTPVVIKSGVELPTFHVTEWDIIECDDMAEGSYGNFSCIQMYFGLARSYGFYIAQVYVPSFLVVSLSWVNFWLDINAIPARISLGLLTVLTTTTMSVGAKSNLPRVSYLKSIDVWLATCLFFVFAALLEFAYVNVTARVEKRRMTMREAVRMATDGAIGTKQNAKDKQEANSTAHMRERARMVDKIARFAFPIVFICFNIFYWCYYML